MKNNGLDEKEFSPGDMYTTLSEAKKEIKKRQNNKDLKRKVEEYLHDIPGVFGDNPKAVLFRNIATPNHESNIFIDLASMLELQPAYLEFSKDKFCTRNKD